MKAPTVIPDRLERVLKLQLEYGNHSSAEKGMCVMEAVAFVAGEDFTDSPECACPILASFLRAWNDSLPDDQRQKLKPYVARLVGSRGSKKLEQKRGLLIADWYLRVFTPTWLELAGLSEHATALRTANEVTSWKHLDALQPTLEKARDQAAAAWDAARAAAWDAAWDAAWAAARDAAWAAAWAAARDAAWAAAWDAAWAAARAAARAAAATHAQQKQTDGQSKSPPSYDVCRKSAELALAPTTERLQASVFELLDRCLEAKP